ncbi:phenylacetate--CoA ligase family protein [Williamsia sp. CHRR-6]|uniref:phenylacetate--CoA ligase family protein n=1 Tax=Williamsia sp. CHRR-6 TaxID=2835871 RepID=UPI001BDB40CF|nr:phenylacetate--CoA ligase family protein [Williamsia sp. CHRR-6]MBT0566280.1 phenylacetate--CoA ligase family protein [Williamsia sp. CHRR-6]
MGPTGARLDVAHRIRRLHPLLPAIRAELARMDHASRPQVVAYQERRLRAMVRWAAARSPFYRELFRQNGIDPRDIRTLNDLTAIPPIDRHHLVERGEEFRTFPAATMWSASSSGTSGRPVGVYRTPGSSAYELCAQARQWSWFGLNASSRRIVLRGSDFAADQPGRPVRDMSANAQLMVSSFHLDDEHLPQIMSAIEAFDPVAIEGWPSSMTVLAGLMQRHGITLPLRGIITSSEVMSGPSRALMRAVFGGPIIDHYGQTERVTMSGNCERGTDHVFEDYGITELIPVEGHPDRWEIVGTPLHNWGFPLLRYRTGDEVGPAPSPTCPCGRGFRTIGPIAGRAEDVFTAADGRPLPLPSTVVDDLVGVLGAQIVQLARGQFEVRVVPGPDYDRAAVAAHIHRNTDRMFGLGQQLAIVELDALVAGGSGKVKTAYVIGT